MKQTNCIPNQPLKIPRGAGQVLLVDKKGNETCTVNKTRNPLLNRVILKCDGDASKLKYMQETFSRHRADQDRMKYHPGKTYYFICKYYPSAI